jgi:predicted transcriptional regulator
MTRPASKHPTELELEILKVLWREPRVPVRHVRDALSKGRDLAYTSVMTVMNIMVDKGYLKRVKDGNGYVYEPIITRESTTRHMLRDTVNRLFDGSVSAAMVHLLDESELNDGEMKELRKLIRRKGEK